MRSPARRWRGALCGGCAPGARRAARCSRRRGAPGFVRAGAARSAAGIGSRISSARARRVRRRVSRFRIRPRGRRARRQRVWRSGRSSRPEGGAASRRFRIRVRAPSKGSGGRSRAAPSVVGLPICAAWPGRAAERFAQLRGHLRLSAGIARSPAAVPRGIDPGPAGSFPERNGRLHGCRALGRRAARARRLGRAGHRHRGLHRGPLSVVRHQARQLERAHRARHAHERLERYVQFLAVLEAHRRLAIERPRQDPVERGGHRGVSLRGGHQRRLEHRAQHLRLRGRVERLVPGGQLVQHHPEREDVGARIELSSLQLLGGDVAVLPADAQAAGGRGPGPWRARSPPPSPRRSSR